MSSAIKEPATPEQVTYVLEHDLFPEAHLEQLDALGANLLIKKHKRQAFFRRYRNLEVAVGVIGILLVMYFYLRQR